MSDDDKTETKRGRVRRLLIDPMKDLGFRKPQGLAEDVFQKKLDGITDDLTYMSDDGLQVLFGFLKSKGQGKDRCFWPCRATILAYAELVEPCPIDKVPGLLSWFRSAAGPRAEREDILVETFDYITKFKKPPTAQSAMAEIKGKAARRVEALSMSRTRIDKGRPLTGDEDAIADYDARLAEVRRLVGMEQGQGEAA